MAYAPSGGDPAGFVATKIFGPDGAPRGVLAVELPLAQVDQTMASRNGLGETGETFLVGADHLFRSNSTFTEANDFLVTTYDSGPLQAALAACYQQPVAPDGVYGPGTAAAVQAVQAVSGLPADGTFGPRGRQPLVVPSPEMSDTF